MEAPGPGTESKPWLQHTLWLGSARCFNQLCWARDWTHTSTATWGSAVRFLTHCVTAETPSACFFVKGSNSEHTPGENVWENTNKQWLPLSIKIGNFSFHFMEFSTIYISPLKRGFITLCVKSFFLPSFFLNKRSVPTYSPASCRSNPKVSRIRQASSEHWIIASFFFPEWMASATSCFPVESSTGNLHWLEGIIALH